MKKMGVKQEEIPAEKVVVYSEGKMLVIQNPHVVKVVMMGEESYQITGNSSWIEVPFTVSEDDIATVQESSGCSREEAEGALKESRGDLAGAIVKVSKTP